MITDDRLSVCDSVRNRSDWNLAECVECRVKIRMIIDAVFGFLVNNRNRTDSR